MDILISLQQEKEYLDDVMQEFKCDLKNAIEILKSVKIGFIDEDLQELIKIKEKNNK